MKKLWVSICLIALVFALSAGALAVPSSVSYDTTRRFLEYCDENDIKYSYMGIDNDNDEKVNLSFDLTNTSVDVRYFFEEDQESCMVRVWNLITFDPDQIAEVRDAVGRANADYRWVKYYIDESDNTVTCAADIYFGGGDAGDICGYILRRVVNISDSVYDDYLGQYNQ